MQHVRSLADIHLRDAWLTIGSFDGVHLGHQQIIVELTAGARAAGSPSVVLTFYPHPSIVIGRRQQALYLTSPERRALLVEELGVDLLITHPFDREVAAKSARQFLKYLKKHLDFQQLWVGHDFAMGHDRDGDVPTLRRLSAELDYQLHVVPPVKVGAEVVSSSRIRDLIAGGAVDQAARLLGRPYELGGVVIPGDGRGKQLGIPTANLAIEGDRALPGTGVYAGKAYTAGATHEAVINVGVRPTFNQRAAEVRIEAHLLNFTGNLYGKQVQLEFIRRLRGEIQFPDPQALVDQIRADIARARQIFDTQP